MAFALPGLFDFSSGVTSAINQNTGRLVNQGMVTSNYLDTLNAFNASMNTNDNLELRQGFAQQPAGTSILDRFSNVAQQSTNPFAVNQAVTAGSALSPLLGLTALQNPLFAASQRLPSTFGAQVNAGLQGGQAIARQDFNAQLPQFLGQNNAAPDIGQILQMFMNTQQQTFDNNAQADYLRLQQQETARLRAAAATNNVTASTVDQTTSQPQRITTPVVPTPNPFASDPGQQLNYSGNQTRG